jgi:hypothetical protein
MRTIHYPPNINKDDFAKLGEEIYRTKYQTELEAQYLGKICAIEVESGDYFIGDTPMEAGMKARKRYPDRIFYAVRIGSDAVYSFKGAARRKA